MANKKITYTLELDAEITSLESKLSKTKGQLDSILKSGQAPTGLEKTFERLDELLGRIKDKSKSPIDSKSGFTSIGKDVDSVNQGLSALSRILGEIASKGSDNFSLLPKDTQAQITAIVKSIEDYEKAIAASTVETKELTAAREALAKATTKVQNAQADAATKTSMLEQAKQERDALQAQIDVIKERQKALKEAKAEQAKVDAFYAKTDENGTKRDRRKKYDEVPYTPAQAKAKVDSLIAASRGDETNLASLQEQLKSAKKDVESYIGQVSTANRVLRETEATAEQAKISFEGLNNAFKTGSEEAKQKAFEQLKKKAEELGVEIDDIGDAFSQEEANTLIKRLNSVSDKAFEKFADNAKEAADAVDGLGENTKRVKGKLEDGTEALQKMIDAASQEEAFEGKIKQFLGLSGAAQVLRSALRDAMATITELDATMTEMAVVTDLTVGDYWDQLPQYSKQASDLGVSINSAYKAATLYYQQGLKGNEVTKISAETLKLAKIAGIDAADATNKMTAALRGFNMELNETSAQRVADVYSELAAITAADVDEISNAMTKTASIASSAGMEFETTAAFLSQIIETTRESAETAGTALKTVIARFQELKKDPSEIGEVDGEIVDANKIETALRSVGVALRDSSGQFRDLDDVFMDLSKKWDGLDKNTQRYIATIAAGSRQQSRFIAMMSDYGRTQELVSAANTSAGASNKQFEKTMDSLEAKIEKLKNAWHEFTMGILNSDLIKFGVDILTNFLEIVNKATSGLEGLGGSIAKIASVLAIFKLGSAIFTKFKEPVIKLFSEIVKLASVSGEKSARAFKESAEKVAQEDSSAQNDNARKSSVQGYSIAKDGSVRKNGKFVTEKEAEEALSAPQAQTKSPGIVKRFNEGRNTLKQLKPKIAENKVKLDAANSRLTNAVSSKDLAVGFGASAEEIAECNKELLAAKQEVESLENEQAELNKQSKQAWGDISSSITAAGQAVTGVGVGMSMLGGLLSSLGLEEFGDALSKVGSIITMIGSALMAIPPILTMITAHPIIALITLIVGLILGAIVGIMSYIDSISAESKLAKAQANVEAAKEAAEQADEAFKDLNNSLSELDNKQTALDNLREGTEEWNKAVQDLNSSVLELIDKYPELSGLVENEGGVLKLDIESDEVQDVIKKYESSAAQAKAVQYGAEAKVTQAQQDVDFSNLSAVNEVSKHRGWSAFGKSTAIGAGVGAGAGVGLGLTTGPFAAILSPILGGVGAVGGALVGAITGAIVGPIENAKTHTDKKLQEATEALALSVQEGATDMDFADMRDFLVQQGVAADEAEIMANEFSKNTDSLIEFGKATQASKAAIEAQYSAMAMQAKQMINLGAYTADEQDQMSNVIDGQAMKEMEEKRAKELEKEYENKSNTEEFDNMKNEYAKEMYGAGARVDGNKILDEAGNVVREFEDENAFAAAMASAQATKEAAKAMEAVPNAINKSAAYFEKKIQGSGEAFEKLFSSKDGKALTQGEIASLSMTKSDLEAFWNLSPGEGGLTTEEKEVYGNDFEKYWSKYNDTLQIAKTSFDASNKKLKEFNKNIELSSKFSAESAKAWVNTLDTLNTGGATGAELEGLDSSFDSIIKSLSPEEIDQVMSEINSIDKTDKKAWDNLLYRFEELGLATKMGEDSLRNFIETGKQVSHAIDKINFNTLADDINNTYKLLDKIKEGGRTYSESDYKELIAGNKALENSFTQIGDDFIYVGASMEDLTSAIKKNTVAKIQEANRQLQSRGQMAEKIKTYNEGKNTNADLMSEYEMMNYLTNLRGEFGAAGLDISDFGIEGLTNQTDFSKASAEQLRKWVSQIVSEGGLAEVYKDDYAKGVRKANIQRYTQNDATYNARMATEGGEYADEHQEALILQAIQSGAVSNATIEAYRQAIEDGNEKAIKEIGADIAESTERIIEDSEGRDAYKELVDRVTDAIEKARQKEIDKLSELNDTLQSTNDKLIQKLQAQIDADRQARENEKTESDIVDLRTQQSYLGMDTSGANALQQQELENQIAEAERSYQDSLVDQAIQNLSDANAEAAEQRQEQIDLLQSQLDWQIENGELTREAEEIVASSLKSGVDVLSSELGKLLWDSEGKGLGKLESENWVKTLTQSATTALNWYSLQGLSTENTTGDGGTGSGGDASGGGIDKNTQLKSNAMAAAKGVLESATDGGYFVQSKDENSTLNKAYQSYLSASGLTAENYSLKQFAADAVGGEENLNKHSFVELGYTNTVGNNWNWDDVENNKEEDGGATLIDNDLGDIRLRVKGGNSQATSAASSRGLANNRVFQYGQDVFVYHNGTAYKVTHWKNAWSGASMSSDLSSIKKKYESGGLADFTGPAWLDGTKSRPEYVLSAEQTERFFALVDVLEGFNDKTTDKKSGDNYFNIQIDVEKLENDYDVEQMANKIRRMIYEDATYRNVNSINLIR